jgi:O-antigen/teichoic acid export membrane protein
MAVRREERRPREKLHFWGPAQRRRVILFGLLGPFMPAMSALDAQGREAALRSLLVRATKLTAIFSLLVAGLLWLNGRALIALWVGERFVGSYAIALVLVVGYAVALAQSPGVVFLQARGRHQIVGWWTVGEGLANVLLSIVLARPLGVFGVALGTAIPMLVIKLTVQPWYVMRTAGLSSRQYLGQSLFRPSAAGIAYFGAIYLVVGETPPHLMALVLRVALQAVGFAILVFAFVANDEDRKLVLEKVEGWRKAGEGRSEGQARTSRTGANDQRVYARGSMGSGPA